MPSAGDDPRYALEQHDEEFDRLARQAIAAGPLTERTFRAAGIAPGMRVLDVGCGVGHVSLLLASLVGPSGSIVAIDRDGASLDRARQLLADSDVDVTFEQDDFRSAATRGVQFDAVVGRFVLMYQADPEATVAELAGVLRSGGVMAFHELDLPDRPPPGMWPPSELSDLLGMGVMAVFRATGTQMRMGSRLPGAYTAAGLEACTRLETESMTGVGRAPIEAIVGLLRSMAPVIKELELFDLDDLGLDTAVDRLMADVPEPGPISMGPVMVGAWARKP